MYVCLCRCDAKVNFNTHYIYIYIYIYICVCVCVCVCVCNYYMILYVCKCGIFKCTYMCIWKKIMDSIRQFVKKNWQQIESGDLYDWLCFSINPHFLFGLLVVNFSSYVYIYLYKFINCQSVMDNGKWHSTLYTHTNTHMYICI